MAELALRLKDMEVDAVWLPPPPKNKNATNDVGYSPFDLGDKYQKSTVCTRFGSKDEFLRMVAVLHANGIEVIQDVMLNRTDGAGTTTGDAGQGPEPTSSMATNSGSKTFHYSSYGATYASGSRFVNQSWEIAPTGPGAVVDATLQGSVSVENIDFQLLKASVYHNDNGSSGTWTVLASTGATGTDPYQLTTTGSSSFSTFAVGSAATPLPVELVRFGAQRTSTAAVLVSWATASKLNYAQFGVEHSPDGQQFERVGAVPCGYSAGQAYSFRHEAGRPAGYYRLR